MKDFLLRQVHPTHFKNGLSSGAFRPTPNDGDMLSVDCGNMTTAEASYNLHLTKTKSLADGNRVPLETAGAWAITRELCASNGLPVSADPLTGIEFQPDNAAHHLVDFSGIAGNPPKKNNTVAKRLKQRALEIGCLWPAGD
jgi:hypothetical protein